MSGNMPPMGNIGNSNSLKQEYGHGGMYSMEYQQWFKSYGSLFYHIPQMTKTIPYPTS